MDKLIFGSAVDSKNGSSEDLANNLKKALTLSNEAVELSFTSLHKVTSSQEVIDLFNEFKYKSIHLPVVEQIGNNKIFLEYPDSKLNDTLKVIDSIIDKSSPNTVLIHPDQVSDFSWAKSKYGKMLAFENMDADKKFGKTIEDMKKVFDLCPDAKWVFDVNHIYTNDNTMETAKDFYNVFKDRLTHYHLSGYGGFHDALCSSKEDIILKGIQSLDFPIIDEGDLLSKGVLEEEFEYISNRIQDYI